MGTGNVASLSGNFQKVTLGATSKILGAGSYSISGSTRNTVDVSEFGTDIDQFDYVNAVGGTITIDNVSYDITDPEQSTLISAMQNKTKLINSVTSGIRFWLNSTSYMTIGTSGTLLVTNAGSVEASRTGVARTKFEMQVSGAFMYIV